jgi:acylaminoacyl-peptidase
MRSGSLEKDKLHPMVVILHGGPFSASPKHMFLTLRNYLMLQGYCLLVVNYRGSVGYGLKSMDSLLGKIGDVDVEDCGNLTLKALEHYKDIVDPIRIGVYGGSHGGFLTGWLTGHPSFKHLWAAAILWNPVLNMSYMVA